MFGISAGKAKANNILYTMRARLAALGILGILPVLLHGFTSSPMLQRRLARHSSSQLRLYAKRPSGKQGADEPSDQDSNGDLTPNPNHPWKTGLTFLGGVFGGVAVSAGVAYMLLTALFTQEIEDPDGLYESTALFSNILTEVG